MDTIHPILVHFPIALLTVGFVCDLIGYYKQKESLKNAGWWSLVFGFGGILLATVSGLYVEGKVGHNDAAHDIMEIHKQVALVATALFTVIVAVRVLLRTKLASNKGLAALYFILGLFATGVLGYGAHLGGSLVYDFGVGSKAAIAAEVVPHDHSNGHGHSHDKGPATPYYTEPNTSPTSESKPTLDGAEPTKATHTHADGSKHTH